MTTLSPARDQFVHLSALVALKAAYRVVHDDDGPAANGVARFTGRLRQLMGVPFKYLVPDPRMLPAESIRFFYVDVNWIQALCDGALSLGRIGGLDAQHDAAVAPRIARAAESAALNQRRLKLGRDATGEPDLQPIFGGFLLRSVLVSGWPGLEVQAFERSTGTGEATEGAGKIIDLIRMERLSPDVLVCLFAEPFGCVQIHEPKEGISYGASRPDPEKAPEDHEKLALRGLGGKYAVGKLIKDTRVKVPQRRGSPRVVEVGELRRAMVEKLKSVGAWTDKDGAFTSAQFALQMVEGASRGVFVREEPEDRSSLPPLPGRRVSSAEMRAADEAQLNDLLLGSSKEKKA